MNWVTLSVCFSDGFLKDKFLDSFNIQGLHSPEVKTLSRHGEVEWEVTFQLDLNNVKWELLYPEGVIDYYRVYRK